MATHIRIRRDTAANWTSVNPVLEIGEPGLETDTRKVKYGDGTSAWTLLPYGSDSGFDGQYSSLTGKPELAVVATTNSYTDLDNKPSLFSGAYTDLTGKPTLFSGAYADLTGKPTIPSKVSDLTNDSGYLTAETVTAGTNLTNGSHTASLDSNGFLSAKMFLADQGAAGAGGFSFSGTEGGNDSGMFSSTDGDVKLIANNEEVFNITTGGLNLKKKVVFSDSTEQTTAWTGSVAYSSVTGTPSIPAAQIQSDWTQTDNTLKDYIKNKPTLSTVATSGAYSDLSGKPTLFSGAYTDLTGKPTLATVATSGSYADLSNTPGIPTDVSQLTDTTNLLASSQNRVEFKSSSFAASVGKSYWVDSTSGALTVTLPASPTAGDWVSLYDGELKWQTNNLTVDGNGHNVRIIVMGGPSGFTWGASAGTVTLNQAAYSPTGPLPSRFIWNGTVWSGAN